MDINKRIHTQDCQDHGLDYCTCPPVDVLLTDCFEAQAFYNGRYKDKDTMIDNVIAEAYLMRSETLLRNDLT